jgi:hypothetical protein
MPIHDWTRVPAELFHDFHQSWTIRIKDALNSGLLPPGLSALVEQRAGRVEPDVLAIESPFHLPRGTASESGEVATLERRHSSQTRRGNRILVTHHTGRIVAVIELISPGSRTALRDMVFTS